MIWVTEASQSFISSPILQVIAEIASRGKLPIIVGGSNYYVQVKQTIRQ
jgi:tRNA A37 N6-isopentenylltransferase MiaA